MNNAFRILIVLAVTLTACAEPARCVEVSRSALTDPNDAILFGGTYGDVLATIVGERSGALRWLESEAYVAGFPSPGEAQITVTIDQPYQAWDIDVQRQGGNRYDRLACPDILQAEAEVAIQSDGGVLDATLAATMSFQAPDTLLYVTDVTDEDLGSLEFRPIEKGASLFLTLSYGSNDGPRGALTLRSGASSDSGDGVGMSVDLATWTLDSNR
ncbi:MAG: hypothetical protein AAGF11_47540 [Myxococcota bacterium]